MFTAKGLYVTESGTGGTKCVTGPATTGPGSTKYCEGPTAAIALISGKHTHVVDGKLPSVLEVDTADASGPSGLTVSKDGRISVLFQDQLVNKDGSNSLAPPLSNVFGTFKISKSRSVNLAKFAALHPQSAAKLGGTPGETAYDSDPYDVVSYRGGYALVDAAANDLLYLNKHDRLSILARFPTEAETAPARVLGPTPVPVNAQAVPTSVAVGPDGALYVGILRGVPSLPGTAQIYRVMPGRTPTVWAKGLTAVTAIAFDGKGRLLATELSTGGLLSPPTVPGALVRTSANGKHVSVLPVSGLFDPTGVAVGRDGAVYVSNYGTNAGTAKKPGEVLQVTGLK